MMNGMRFRLLSIVLVSSALLLIGSSAFAQATQPADANGGFNGYAPNSYSSYPAAEVQAVPVARAQAARARAEMDLAQRNLWRWIDRSWDDFEHSPEYLDASNAEKRAYEDYQRERNRVLSRLSNDSTYVAMIDLIGELREKLDRERPRTMVSTTYQIEEMLATATIKLGYASTVSAMEAAALQADQGFQDARQRLVNAGTRAREMREKFGRGVRRDPQFLAQRDMVDQLRVARIVSDNFLEGAINARAIALDYAFWVDRFIYYRYSQYGIYGYPYGYDSYFGGPYIRRY
jgi:hypothetical protein